VPGAGIIGRIPSGAAGAVGSAGAAGVSVGGGATSGTSGVGAPGLGSFGVDSPGTCGHSGGVAGHSMCGHEGCGGFVPGSVGRGGVVGVGTRVVVRSVVVSLVDVGACSGVRFVCGSDVGGAT
jgi:hypothetical protein